MAQNEKNSILDFLLNDPLYCLIICKKRESKMQTMPFLNAAGETYGDFIVTKITSLPELNCTLRELIHTPSHASIMHIDNEDPENLFCLSFQTLPSSSNGVAHILEHTVLCGSRRFPIKDPFFAMNRRSLNTFMNALTGSDFTCYPAATLNEKDFYNLLDVYLDAVFHPELKKMSFLQEGHRLEFANPQDPKTALEYKGIVFNEMKGSLSSIDTRLWHAMMQELVPDLPYAFNSGGDPKEIPCLTYEELLSFHETYYHPSRCLFFFYGNFPLQKHLDFIHEKTLKHAVKAPPLPLIARQRRFSKPVQKKLSYPVNESDPMEQRSLFALGFLTAPLIKQEEVLALCVLDSILMETDASLLKQPLLASKLCVHVDALIDTEMSEVPYVITFKGCEEKHLPQLETLFRQTLEEIVKKGIDSHLIDAAIHQMELSRSEITGDHAPFGLTLFMRSALAKQHGCDPEKTLSLHSLFDQLLKKVKDPHYLTSLIQHYFLDNPHYVRLEMHPDPKLSSQEIALEKQELTKIKKKLSKEETCALILQAKELSHFQKQTEKQSIDCLPKVTLKDVTPITKEFPLKRIEHKNLTIFHHDCFTNGILYADLLFDLPPIQEADLPFVHLLTSLLTEIGSGTRSYTENLSYLNAYTGGLSASTSLHLQTLDPTQAKPAFHLRGKALYRNVDKLFSVMKDTLLKPRWNEKERIKDLILQLREGQLHRFNRQAMRYAVQLSLSSFSQAAYVSEAWHGLTYFKAIETLTQDLPSKLDSLVHQLAHLFSDLMTFHQPHLVLSCSKEMLHQLEKEDFFRLYDLPAKPNFTPWKLNYELPTIASQTRAISAQVAFTSQAFSVGPYIHPHAPALTIASLLFDHLTLHPNIREQGGAYGCGATYNSILGLFYFHSYRDPNLTSTLVSFEEAINQIALGQFDSSDLEEAKLGIIQQLDTPIAPGSRASAAYSWYREGKSHAMRQEFRERLLSLSEKELQTVVQTDLLPQKGKGVIVSFAGKELIEKEKEHLKTAGKQLTHFPI